MKKYFCDRCGKEITNVLGKGITSKVKIEPNDEKLEVDFGNFELCADCGKAFLAFIRGFDSEKDENKLIEKC